VKTVNSKTVILVVMFCAVRVFSQGTVVFDQQSSDESRILEGGADIQQNQPIGQSFTPTFDSVGFVRLYLYNGLLGNTSAATVQVGLREGSISGPLLGVSAPVSIPASPNFGGSVQFRFGVPVPGTPGCVYFLQPTVLDNDNIGLSQSLYGYGGGTAFFQGVADPQGRDIWFREGIIVPEPGTAVLLLLGVASVVLRRR